MLIESALYYLQSYLDHTQIGCRVMEARVDIVRKSGVSFPRMRGFSPCDYNRKLKCKLKNDRCPLQDARFCRDLELFLYVGRTPRSVSLEPIKTHNFAHHNDFLDIIKAFKAMIFADDFIFEYDELCKTGNIDMTYRKCRQWREARAKWRRLFDFPV